jgi:hypothetical protein
VYLTYMSFTYMLLTCIKALTLIVAVETVAGAAQKTAPGTSSRR